MSTHLPHDSPVADKPPHLAHRRGPDHRRRRTAKRRVYPREAAKAGGPTRLSSQVSSVVARGLYQVILGLRRSAELARPAWSPGGLAIN